MSTRCVIIARMPDGKYKGIYCHHDGYLNGVGQKLLDCYTRPAVVRNLVNRGCIDGLEDTVDDSPLLPDDDICSFVGDHWYRVQDHFHHNGHVYVYDHGVWFYNGLPLVDELNKRSKR
jgi:hypothetical protein